jgi:hypothetical protein
MKVDRRLALSVSLSANINLKMVKFPSSFWNTGCTHTMNLCVRMITTIDSVKLFIQRWPIGIIDAAHCSL